LNEKQNLKLALGIDVRESSFVGTEENVEISRWSKTERKTSWMNTALRDNTLQ
jgi:hypothetical protein